ncbi:hypothetical protein CHMI_02533 [Cellulomonas hominis]|nr:hypothetical protein CHMI_02533 [Cellulomonas hominis]
MSSTEAPVATGVARPRTPVPHTQLTLPLKPFQICPGGRALRSKH